MNASEKLTYIKAIVGITGTAEDALINVYLTLAAQEIINWKYSLIGIPEGLTDVDTEDEVVQIHAVIAGYNIRGAENQTSHNENQIYRTFDANDMVDYVRTHIIAYAKLV